jgi:hypothetical protein
MVRGNHEIEMQTAEILVYISSETMNMQHKLNILIKKYRENEMKPLKINQAW